MSQYLIGELDATPNVDVRFNAEDVDGGGEGRLQWVSVRDRASGDVARLPTAALLVLIGASPHTGWLPDAIVRDRWGFVLTGTDVTADEDASAAWPLERPPLVFETTLPGVFAVGDVRHRSVKRVASAVGEASVAIREVHEYLSGLVDAPAARP